MTPGRGRVLLVAVLTAILLAGCVAGLSLGRPVIAPVQLISVLAEPHDSTTYVVLRELRLPRVLLGVFAGACLGAAGLILQEALRNSLAAPELVGVSAGASLAVAATVVMNLTPGPGFLPSVTIVGGLGGGLLTLAAARRARSPSTVLLTGAAVSAALNGAFLAAFALAGELQIRLLFRFLLGSLYGRNWHDVAAVWPWLALSVPATILCAPVLSVLRLGDEAAAALGVRVERARGAALAVAVVLVGPVVAICGPIAWVGLLAPHVARRLRPHDDSLGWLPVTCLCGALIVVVADLAARLLFYPIETPLGAWTALVGVLGGVALARPQRRRT